MAPVKHVGYKRLYEVLLEMTVASKQENEEKERKENEKGKKKKDAEESGPEANEHMEEVVVRE